MVTESEGIVFRQIKTLGGRRMVVIFTEKYGKIRAGTYISERGKSKAALALRPFTRGRYELSSGRESYSVAAAEVVQSHFSIGEDLDKYLAASSALELTDAALEEEQPAEPLYRLLSDFLDLLADRGGASRTLLCAYMLQALSFLGCAPRLQRCALCGGAEGLAFFSAGAGGALCGACAEKEKAAGRPAEAIGEDGIEALRYMQHRPIQHFKTLALSPQKEQELQTLLRAYYAWHLGIDRLRSEELAM